MSTPLRKDFGVRVEVYFPKKSLTKRIFMADHFYDYLITKVVAKQHILCIVELCQIAQIKAIWTKKDSLYDFSNDHGDTHRFSLCSNPLLTHSTKCISSKKKYDLPHEFGQGKRKILNLL